MKRSTVSTPGLLASSDLSDAMRLHRQGTERRATISKIRKQFKTLSAIEAPVTFNRQTFAAIAKDAPTFSKNFDSQKDLDNVGLLQAETKVDLRSHLSIVADSAKVEVWLITPALMEIMPPHV